jgi:hypothetical protein
MAGANPNYLAGGTISPCRFVTPDASNDTRVTQAVAGSPIAGISGASTETPPTPSNTSYHATTGNPCRVHGSGEQALLELGATVTRGQYLVSDANGKGIPFDLTGKAHEYGAVALASGVAGDIRNVQVLRGRAPATAS